MTAIENYTFAIDGHVRAIQAALSTKQPYSEALRPTFAAASRMANQCGEILRSEINARGNSDATVSAAIQAQWVAGTARDGIYSPLRYSVYAFAAATRSTLDANITAIIAATTTLGLVSPYTTQLTTATTGLTTIADAIT